MTDIAKTLMTVGVLLLISGLSLYMLGKIPGLGKLPGDIVVKRANFTVYFPIATCLLISLILSLMMFLWNRR